MIEAWSQNNTIVNIIAQDWQDFYKNKCDVILLFDIFQGLVLWAKYVKQIQLTKQTENLTHKLCIETAGTIHFWSKVPIQYSWTKTLGRK